MLLTKNKTLRRIAGLFETFNYLFFKLLIKNPSKASAFPGKVFREYMSLAGKDKWVHKDFADIFSIEEGIRLTIDHLPGRGVSNKLDELAYLALITKIVTPNRIFEIGTFRGRTALNFALNSPGDCIVYTLDLPPDERNEQISKSYEIDANIIRAGVTGADYQGKDVEKKIKQLYGNSLKFDFSPYFGKIDLVFVDGAHHYEAVKSDTAHALKMVRPGGVIIWHDFANYGDYNDVTRAVLDILPGNEVIQIEVTQLALYQHKT